MTKKDNFKKIWIKEWDREDGYRTVVVITTVDKNDLKEEKEIEDERGNKYKVKIYKFKMGFVDGEEKDAEMRINKTDRVLGKIIIGDKEYTMRRYLKSKEEKFYLFKIYDLYWVKVVETRDIDGKPVYRLKLTYTYDPDTVVNDADEDEMF